MDNENIRETLRKTAQNLLLLEEDREEQIRIRTSGKEYLVTIHPLGILDVGKLLKAVSEKLPENPAEAKPDRHLLIDLLSSFTPLIASALTFEPEFEGNVEEWLKTCKNATIILKIVSSIVDLMDASTLMDSFIRLVGTLSPMIAMGLRMQAMTTVATRSTS